MHRHQVRRQVAAERRAYAAAIHRLWQDQASGDSAIDGLYANLTSGNGLNHEDAMPLVCAITERRLMVRLCELRADRAA